MTDTTADEAEAKLDRLEKAIDHVEESGYDYEITDDDLNGIGLLMVSSAAPDLGTKRYVIRLPNGSLQKAKDKRAELQDHIETLEAERTEAESVDLLDRIRSYLSRPSA